MTFLHIIASNATFGTMMGSGSKSSIATNAAFAASEVATIIFTVMLVEAVTPPRSKIRTRAWRMQCEETARCACRISFNRSRKSRSCNAAIPFTRTAFGNCKCRLQDCSPCGAPYAACLSTAATICGTRLTGRSRRRQCLLNTGRYHWVRSRRSRRSQVPRLNQLERVAKRFFMGDSQESTIS
ncbi:unnamed protein product [Durusdinium trenchii]|uniref:Uncharacterized protein n=1 Tax=Durusdinium trenchii TaxID=1381693 RepID=A0ABP0SSQ5_9DINO